MIYCFDLDGTLCTKVNDGNYNKAKPIYKNITKVNILFDEGNTIIIDTARGTTTGINWENITIDQLNNWGIKFHKIRCGHKPHADIFIDDKAINASNFFEETIGNKLDEYIKLKIHETLNINLFPDYDDIYTDTISELIDKLIIVHIRYWYLEDAMALEKDDIKLADLRRKSESLFKEKRPMLIAGLDKNILNLLRNKTNYTPMNMKQYKGWNQKDI